MSLVLNVNQAHFYFLLLQNSTVMAFWGIFLCFISIKNLIWSTGVFYFPIFICNNLATSKIYLHA